MFNINLLDKQLSDFPNIHVVSGADPGILVRGGVDFFSKAWGSGPALRSPVGPGQRPGGFPGGEAPGTS